MNTWVKLYLVNGKVRCDLASATGTVHLWTEGQCCNREWIMAQAVSIVELTGMKLEKAAGL
jgi:hypothetical protein